MSNILRGIIIVYITLIINGNKCYSQEIEAHVESATTIHSGKNIPLWQMSNQHGLSSIKNSAYIRGAVFYNKSVHSWKLESGIDIAMAAGHNSTFILQQAYIDTRYKWIGLWAGSREINFSMLNQELTSGGLTWSGNVRPIPQVALGIFDYISILPRVQVKAEISYGWFTDNKYHEKHFGGEYSYANSIKYHHKSFSVRLGKPTGKWLFDLGMCMENQFGGFLISDGNRTDLGNGWKDYYRAMIPQGGTDDNLEGEQVWYAGNYLGSEYFKLTYKAKKYVLSAYLENYFDDFSGMGKLNGLDGLWGLELKIDKRQLVNELVLEYYQTTNQSGPLHGLDFSIVKKTGGADNYYNHYIYTGWSHWGMTIGNPLVASPIYNDDHFPGFRYNRIKAFHLGWSGNINKEFDYRAKMSFNRTWGTHFEPLPTILENFSTFAEIKYTPKAWKGWSITASAAFDIGSIYGDNLGFQLKIHKKFRK